jgi:hypothetical protein
MTGLFSHGPIPLADTLDFAGDPGLLGPDSVSWRVLGDAAVFVGGIRALVIQSAHAEVVAGVEDHSTYRADPLGRLSRTSVYVTETTYGAMPEVEAAIQVVRRALWGPHTRSCGLTRANAATASLPPRCGASARPAASTQPQIDPTSLGHSSSTPRPRWPVISSPSTARCSVATTC